jgi:hypothetical protein
MWQSIRNEKNVLYFVRSFLLYNKNTKHTEKPVLRNSPFFPSKKKKKLNENGKEEETVFFLKFSF